MTEVIYFAIGEHSFGRGNTPVQAKYHASAYGGGIRQEDGSRRFGVVRVLAPDHLASEVYFRSDGALVGPADIEVQYVSGPDVLNVKTAK